MNRIRGWWDAARGAVYRRVQYIRADLMQRLQKVNWPVLWKTHLFPGGASILVGAVLGVAMAGFIVDGAWHFIFALLLLIPAAILFNTYPFVALLIWVLLMPFLQTTINAAYRTVFWIIHRGMPVVALLVVILSNMFDLNPRRDARLGRAEIISFFYLGFAVFNVFLFYKSPIANLYLVYDRIFIPICLYLFIRMAQPDETDVKRLIPILLFLAIFEGIVGILSQMAPQVLPPEWINYGGERTVGTFVYPHAYTTSLTFYGYLLFYWARHQKRAFWRGLAMLGFTLASLGVFLSYSRGSWMGTLAGAVGLLILYPKVMIRTLLVLLVVMSFLATDLLAEQLAFANERLDSEDTANDRWVIWNAGLQMIKRKPIFGWGYDSYSRYAWRFQMRVNNYVAKNNHASHNSLLGLASELGIPALLCYLFPVFWWLNLTFKVWPRLPKEGFWSRSLLIVLWMVIVDHLIVTVFSDMRHSTYGTGMWWITLGLIANQVNLYLQPDDMKPPEWIIRVAAER